MGRPKKTEATEVQGEEIPAINEKGTAEAPAEPAAEQRKRRGRPPGSSSKKKKAANVPLHLPPEMLAPLLKVPLELPNRFLAAKKGVVLAYDPNLVALAEQLGVMWIQSIGLEIPIGWGVLAVYAMIFMNASIVPLDKVRAHAEMEQKRREAIERENRGAAGRTDVAQVVNLKGVKTDASNASPVSADAPSA